MKIAIPVHFAHLNIFCCSFDETLHLYSMKFFLERAGELRPIIY
jgi:hypothetical protein